MSTSEYRKLYLAAYIECPCGHQYQRHSAWKHKNTIFHRQYVKYNGGWLTPEEYFKARALLIARKLNNNTKIE